MLSHFLDLFILLSLRSFHLSLQNYVGEGPHVKLDDAEDEGQANLSDAYHDHPLTILSQLDVLLKARRMSIEHV